MDPVKEPMCAVCGATTDLVGRPEAGWVCAVEGPCIDRSTKRAWLPVKEMRIESSGDGELRVFQVVEPFHREEYSPEAKSHFEKVVAMGSMLAPPIDELHPTGRCTCGGEGQCDWCMSHCIYCGSSVWPHDEGELPDYEALGYPETDVRYTPYRFETLIDQVLSWWR